MSDDGIKVIRRGEHNGWEAYRIADGQPLVEADTLGEIKNALNEEVTR